MIEFLLLDIPTIIFRNPGSDISFPFTSTFYLIGLDKTWISVSSYISISFYIIVLVRNYCY